MTRGRDLRGSVVVVTGAARGVGASLARQLAARGAHLALLGLEPAQLADVATACPGSAWWEVDVTDRRPWSGSPPRLCTGSAESTSSWSTPASPQVGSCSRPT